MTCFCLASASLQTGIRRCADLPAIAFSLTIKQTTLYRSALAREPNCVGLYESFYWFLKKKKHGVRHLNFFVSPTRKNMSQ